MATINQIKKTFVDSIDNIIEIIDRQKVYLSESATNNSENNIIGYDQMKRDLFCEKERNRLGVARVLVLGTANSGKSTLVNFLCGKIVVPEVAGTSTLIPTWIGTPHDNKNVDLTTVYYSQLTQSGKLSENVTLEKFRREYCYKTEDMSDPQRLRWKDRLLFESYMPLSKSNFSKYGVALVDTLGIGASSADDILAKANLRDCDYAIFLIGSNGVILDHEIKFLTDIVLNEGISNIKPENIIFLINKIDQSQAPLLSKQTTEHAIKALLDRKYPKGSPAGLLEKMKSNIVPFSALFARLATIGTYPHRDDTIAIKDVNSFDKLPLLDQQIIEEKEGFEKRIKTVFSEAELKKDAHITEFSQVFEDRILKLYKDGSATENRFSNLLTVSNGIEKQLRAIIKANDSSIADIQRSIDLLMTAKNEISVKIAESKENADKIIECMGRNINNWISDGIRTEGSVGYARFEGWLSKLNDFSEKKRNEILEKINNSTIPSLQEIKNWTTADWEKNIYKKYFEQPLKETFDYMIDMIYSSLKDEKYNPKGILTEQIYSLSNGVLKPNSHHIIGILEQLRKDNLILNGIIIDDKLIDNQMRNAVDMLILDIQKNFKVELNKEDSEIKKHIIDTLSDLEFVWFSFFKNDTKVAAIKYAKSISNGLIKINEVVIAQFLKMFTNGFLDSEARFRLSTQSGKVVNKYFNSIEGYLNSIEQKLIALRESLAAGRGLSDKVRASFENEFKRIAEINADINKMKQQIKTVEFDK